MRAITFHIAFLKWWACKFIGPFHKEIFWSSLSTLRMEDIPEQPLPGDEWVRVEAMVLGDSVIRHYVNGEMVLAYEMPQIGGGSVSHFDPKAKEDGKLLTEGYISLQSESHPIEFRKVELLNLAGCMDPKAKNYKTYFVKAENSTCQF